MSLTLNRLGPSASTVDGADFSAVSNSNWNTRSLIVAFVVNSVASGTPDTPVIVNAPGGNETWTQLDTIVAASGLARLTCFSVLTPNQIPSTTDTLDVHFPAGSQTGCCIYASIFRSTADLAYARIVQVAHDNGSGQPSISTLAALGAHSWVYAAFEIPRASPTLTADTGWTKRTDSGYTSPAIGLVDLDSAGETADNSPSGTWTAGTWCGIGVEIAVPQVRSSMIGNWRRRQSGLLVR